VLIDNCDAKALTYNESEKKLVSETLQRLLFDPLMQSSARLFMMGVSPILRLELNNINDVTNSVELAEFVGLTQSYVSQNVARVLCASQPLNASEINFLIKQMCNGYFFTSASKGVYNCTATKVILNAIRDPKILIQLIRICNSISTIDGPLDDSLDRVINLLCTEENFSSLTAVQDSIESLNIVRELLNNNACANTQLECVERLVCISALSKVGDKVLVPNVYARHFLKAWLEKLERRKMEICFSELMVTNSISPLVEETSAKLLKIISGNDVVHARELDLKTMFLTVAQLCKNSDDKVYSEYMNSDMVVSTKSKMIHLEFKSIPYFELSSFTREATHLNDWNRAKQYCADLGKLSNDTIMQLGFMDTKGFFTIGEKANLLGKEIKTIHDYKENALEQARRNRSSLIAHVKDKEIHSYCVIRVGLYKLLWFKIE